MLVESDANLETSIQKHRNDGTEPEVVSSAFAPLVSGENPSGSRKLRTH